MVQKQFTTPVICIPFAGSTKSSYAKLARAMQPTFNLEVLELSGHGTRFNDVLLKNIEDMASDLLKKINWKPDEEYFVWGHSLGGLIAYELVLLLQRLGLPLPSHLYISGCQSPAHLPYKKIACWINLPFKDFWEEMYKLGGIPNEVFHEKSLLELYEPVMKSDLEAILHYRYRAVQLHSIPITTITGDYEEIEQDKVMDWRQMTSGEFTFYNFPGNHFGIFDKPELLGKLFSEQMKWQTRD